MVLDLYDIFFSKEKIKKICMFNFLPCIYYCFDYWFKLISYFRKLLL